MYSNGFPNQSMFRADRGNKQFQNGSKARTNQQNGKVKPLDQIRNENYCPLGAKLEKPMWNFDSLRPFPKNFYTTHANDTQSCEKDVRKFRAIREISVFGNEIPFPIEKFEDVNFPDFVVQEICKKGFAEPTAIQAQGWPIALSGRDLAGIAQTGSGKTLAYMLPAAVHISHQPKLNKGKGPIALVLAPTSKDAIHIHSVARDYFGFGPSAQIRNTCVFGGAPKGPQATDLENGVEIVIATPGRLLDFLESGTTNLRRCTYLVLDGVDRMLQLGYIYRIRKIIEQIRPHRQVLMWSATWPKPLREFAETVLNDYIQINVGYIDLHMNQQVRHITDVCQELGKEAKLSRILLELGGQKSIIFVDTTKKVDVLTKLIKRDGWQAISIHGDESQPEREHVLAEFRSAQSNILVATDVAARGLDVEDVKYVINFDYPNTVDDYMKRISRSGQGILSYPVEWNELDAFITYFFLEPNNEEKREELHAIHLTEISEMKRFKEKIETELVPPLNTQNCYKIAVAAKKLNSPTIKKAAIDFIVSNSKNLLGTEGDRQFFDDKRNSDLLTEVFFGLARKKSRDNPATL